MPLAPTEDLHVRAILAAAKQGAEGDGQNLVEVVTDILRSWIGNLRETGDEIFPV